MIPILLLCTILFFNPTFADEEYKVPSIMINCAHDDHCGDFRMVCSAKKEICVCARFYDWDEELQQCHLNLSELGIWLSSMKEEKDIRDEVVEEANKVFSRLAISGFVAIMLGLFGGLLCVYSFCFPVIFAPLLVSFVVFNYLCRD